MLVLRELTLALRSGGGTVLALGFFLMVVVISALGMGRDPSLLSAAAPGVIFTGALLSTLLSLDRLFQSDFEDGTLEALLLAPVAGEVMVLAKVLAHWLTTGLPMVVLSPLVALMLGLPISLWPQMVVTLVLGTASFSAIGSIGAAITLGIRRGGLILSLLTMPLYLPTLIFAVTAFHVPTPSLASTPVYLLSAICLFSIALAPWVSLTAIRIHLRN